jgi:hypothetical protein
VQTYSESSVTQRLAIYHSRHAANGIEIGGDHHALPLRPGSGTHDAGADGAYVLSRRLLSVLWMLRAVQLNGYNLRESLGAPAAPRSHLSLPQIEENYLYDRLMNRSTDRRALGNRGVSLSSSFLSPAHTNLGKPGKRFAARDCFFLSYMA